MSSGNRRSTTWVSYSECGEAVEVGESGTGAGSGSQKVTIGDPRPGSVTVNVAGLRKWEVQEQGQGQTHEQWQSDILGQGQTHEHWQLETLGQGQWQ